MSNLFRFVVNRQTVFYYWMQAVSGWHVPTGEGDLYSSYSTNLEGCTPGQLKAVANIKSILTSTKYPRRVLDELYTGSISSQEARIIDKEARQLMDAFDLYWGTINGPLDEWKLALKKYNYSHIATEMNRIAYFLRSKLHNTQQKTTVYLLPNISGRGSSGHVFRESEFILLHPRQGITDESIKKTVTVLLHENVPVIEFSSATISDMLKQSFLKNRHNLGNPPEGSSWKYLCSEVIAYCFANNITGGYFRAELYNSTIPTTQEFKESYRKLISSHSEKTSQKIAWIGLTVLPTVQAKLEANAQFDEQVADEILSRVIEYI